MTGRSNNSSLALIVAVVIAVMSMVSATIGPLLLSSLNDRQRQAERAEDFRRQDEVAARAAEAAAEAKQSAQETKVQLEEIHLLVNSQLTEALQNELDALVRELAMMNELIELKKFNGLQPTATVLEVLDASKNRITELRTKISDRDKQQAAIDEQSAQ